MRRVPPIRELERICGGEGRGAAEGRGFRHAYARVVRKLSIRLTWLLLKLGVGAAAATLGGIAVGAAGAVLLATTNAWLLLAGLVLLQLSFVIDFSDGEIARFEGTTGASGAYLDWIGHYYLPGLIAAALTWGAIRSGATEWLLIPGVILLFGLLKLPYAARDWVLLSVYRDDESARADPEFLRAVYARQGGDPERIELNDRTADRRRGVGGRGLLWRRYTNLGQILVFPGFVNLVSLAVVIDVVLSNGFPDVHSSTARAVLVAGLGLVHLLHQLRAAAQSARLLRSL
jgi:hypothetical protein